MDAKQEKIASPGVECLNLSVVYRDITDLKPDPRNARQHSRKQIRQIAESIRAFGFNVPLLVHGAGQVIAGHGRLLAAQSLGWSQVPTIAIEHLDEAQRRAFMIADNRLTEISVWDDRLLGEQLKELSLLDLSFDLETIGFDMAEIDLRIESLSKTTEPELEPPEVIPPGPPVSVLGDLWVLGRHKVLCGDARESVRFDRLLGDEKAAAVLSDPPFNVRIDGHATGLGRHRHREFAMAAGEMSTEAFTRFLQIAMENMQRACKSGALCYLFMDWRHAHEILAAAAALHLHLVNICVWTKPNAGMGSLYRSQHELVFVFRSGKEAHRNNVQLGRFGRNRSNVWAFTGNPAFGRAGEEGHLAQLHPTVKPVPMLAEAILDCTVRNAIILDPFLGSGSTLIAAERTGRRCYGIELDPLYVDVIVRRWQAHSGQTARHAVTRAPFDNANASQSKADTGAAS